MIVIPAGIWREAMDSVRTAPHDREQVAFLDGIEAGAHSVVTTLALPLAKETRGNYAITAKEMSRAGRHLRELGLIRVAQVHTHPSDWTGHSRYDDEMAYSQADGAISIVVPHFAGTAPGLGDCSVHLRTESGWMELSTDERASMIMIVPSVIDLRP